MIAKNAMQFKAIIKQKAQELKTTPQLLLHAYIIERFLERLAKSEFNKFFIIKGGFLLSNIISIENRSTMDLDVTIRGYDLNDYSLMKIFKKIIAIELDDQITFEYRSTANIRNDFVYPGIRVNMVAYFSTIEVPFSVDVSTGDIITPSEINYQYKKLFSSEYLQISTYNLETIMAEKIDSILSKGTNNTRQRDYYDLYMICKLKKDEYNLSTLKQAVINTMSQRNNTKNFYNYKSILVEIVNDSNMNNWWIKYQNKYYYAKGVSFNDICSLINEILEKLINTI